MRALRERDSSFSQRLRNFVLAMLVPFTALQIYNLVVLAVGWIFATAVLAHLALALLLFVRLVQASWAREVGGP